ncbi:hypothetical protein AAFP35_13055 [Gordonia sp. CPCC 206044]|uniref:hypothetical protein n=1 Tax=Gordonia sp. CPCC 206044 TaxID=3140793 RepID=UPI003AF3DB97
MSGWAVLGIVVAVLAVIGIVAILAAIVLCGLATKPDRFAVREVSADSIDDYFERRASFAITIVETTPLSRKEVWERLTTAEYLSSLPFLHGPSWAPDTGDPDGDWRSVRVGARRSMSGTILSVGQRVVEVDDSESLTLVGTGVSVPLAIKDFAERFTIVDGARPNTLTVTWQIGGSPRWVGFLPWRWGTPFMRPILGFVLRHVLRLKPFRRPTVDRSA